MAVITPELKMNKFVEELFNNRAAKKVQKEALALSVEYWHKNILPLHFNRSAYARYANEYIKRKKRGDPMVKSGNLKKTALNSLRVSGTAKRARGRFNFGVPHPKTKREIRAIAWNMHYKEYVDFKVALRRVSLSQGNYGKNRKQFELQTTAMNNQDLDMIATFIKEYVVSEYNKKRKGSRKRKARSV